MATRYVNIDRDTPLLLPMDLRDWVADDDLAHFIVEAVNGVRMEGFTSNVKGCGSRQYPPRMMLALLVYCYSHGIFGSRRIERATYQHLSVRYISANTHPDHDTICKFRRENFEAVTECFLRVLELAKEVGVLQVGTVAIDGTRLRANASKHKNISYERAGELVEMLKEDVAELLKKAEQADTESSVGEGLPEELQRREKLQSALEEARKKIEARSLKEAKTLQAEYEAKVREREQRPGNRKGTPPTPPVSVPEATAQINLSDEDSRLMRRSKNEAFEQCYNAQAAVCADGSQLILGVQVSQNSADNHELEPTLEAMSANVGSPARVLVDSGYLNSEAFGRVMAGGVEVYGAVAAEASMARRRYEYRPKDRRRESPVEHKQPLLVAMKEKLASEEGRAIYARRQTSVETAFGIIKSAMGFRQFLLRGHLKASGEWTLVALAYNCKRLCSLRRAKSTQRSSAKPALGKNQRSLSTHSTLL